MEIKRKIYSKLCERKATVKLVCSSTPMFHPDTPQPLYFLSLRAKIK